MLLNRGLRGEMLCLMCLMWQCRWWSPPTVEPAGCPCSWTRSSPRTSPGRGSCSWRSTAFSTTPRTSSARTRPPAAARTGQRAIARRRRHPQRRVRASQGHGAGPVRRRPHPAPGLPAPAPRVARGPHRCGRGRPDPRRLPGHPLRRRVRRPANRRLLDAAYHREAGQRWVSWAANNSVHREAWARVGGFDPRFVYGQDSELGWRLAAPASRSSSTPRSRSSTGARARRPPDACRGRSWPAPPAGSSTEVHPGARPPDESPRAAPASTTPRSRPWPGACATSRATSASAVCWTGPAPAARRPRRAGGGVRRRGGRAVGPSSR